VYSLLHRIRLVKYLSRAASNTKPFGFLKARRVSAFQTYVSLAFDVTLVPSLKPAWRKNVFTTCTGTAMPTSGPVIIVFTVATQFDLFD
jgi:hypothetical protein